MGLSQGAHSPILALLPARVPSANSGQAARAFWLGIPTARTRSVSVGQKTRMHPEPGQAEADYIIKERGTGPSAEAKSSGLTRRAFCFQFDD